ncbi:helix-turn-helix domain-containing protein [Listeria monocytogenes]|uniref:helix-turn-helix domain-containing protein n=1 Tax=Listeria monocytogenes TaxID=1639 RepID=UPI000E714DCA|nr:helix-turn-helix domain-containing protein [Listeria monocytogenes]EHC5218901.1 helix-turn-helix domain-containing protein [Listeria monocytogenes serotype 1/2b]EAC2361927.1 helix-turn-helix domain-containing protein [Listeria monocytogenes]EAD0506557.1 helix-turn-helix domain-containing protein [Listeria monocytogenes]EAE0042310.1 helix-turn-helix domain-containing protein [Listeria monocytogenes]EAE3807671.1 helix-turn-helix domain-containing protein [Listeria monocytogenes]
MARIEYGEEIQKSLLVLYSRGSTIDSICREYGIPRYEFHKWMKLHDADKLETKEVKTFLQVRELKQQKNKLEEEIMFLNEAINLLESP